MTFIAPWRKVSDPRRMTMGRAPTHEDLFTSTTDVCDAALSETSIYRLLHREAHRLFADDAFADLFEDVGRRSISPRIVAVVMVLQRLEGLSDREAVDRFAFDLRWKYAAGGLPYDHPSFVHTVLVEMRARLRSSERPHRIFDAVLDVAKAAGLVGRRRVLDSTPLYDAVATQDTVTMIRSAIRLLLRAAGDELGATLRAKLTRDDDYAAAGKPACNWDDASAREALVDALARDGFAMLASLDGLLLEPDVQRQASLLATVLGQDLEEAEDGRFRIARRVAPDRVISTVDPEARHGHKTAARGFDGYKGHIAIDPDSELIVSTTVTPGNAGDGSVAQELLADLMPSIAPATPEARPSDAPAPPAESAEPSGQAPPEVYGDASYGSAEVLEVLDGKAKVFVKVQPPASPGGLFSKDRFVVDVDAARVTCPAGHHATIRRQPDGSGRANFGALCAGCPLRSQCTTSPKGRNIQVHRREALLARERKRQRDAAWRQQYKATRPKVERKLSHLMRRRHGGRRARVRGTERIGQDFSMLSAAVNLQRLAALRLGTSPRADADARRP